MLKAARILLRVAVVTYALLLLILYFSQRSLIYFPSHLDRAGALRPWIVDERIIGYCREAANPESVWLVAHGNGGQAASREYMLRCFSPEASVYVVEYPGYGARPGRPSAASLNGAVSDAYTLLVKKYSSIGVGVVGESLGSGPACLLASHSVPPKKIVLVVPFDNLVNVAAERMPLIPLRLLLKDRWDNIQALSAYVGPVEVYGASRDTVIPVRHAQRLAEAVHARFTLLSGDHNVWSESRIAIR